MSFPGGWEWVIIAIVVLVFFGPKRLPEMAKGIGKGIREFKGALSGINDEIEKASKTPPQVEADEKSEETKKEAGTS